MAEIKITSANFEAEVVKSPVPVVVDFWASWCGPCRMLAPIIAEIAEEKAGTVKVGKINVDEEGELAVRFGVSAIPMVAKFENGQMTAQTVGYMKKADLEKALGI